jgi:hypothetical protein
MGFKQRGEGASTRGQLLLVAFGDLGIFVSAGHRDESAAARGVSLNPAGAQGVVVPHSRDAGARQSSARRKLDLNQLQAALGRFGKAPMDLKVA